MKTSKCKGCGANIIWANVEGSHKKMPLDEIPEKRILVYEIDNEIVASIRPTYTSHFATCPQAGLFRKDK